MGFPVILHISDLHFGVDNDTTVLDRFIHAMDNLEVVPNFIVASGDFSYSGERSSFRKARRFLRALRERFNINDPRRMITVPGNHDMAFPSRFINVQHSLRNYRRFGFRESTYEFFPEERIVFVGFNSNVLRFKSFLVGGKVGERQLEHAKKHITTNDLLFADSFKVAILHHHPIPIPLVNHNNFDVLRDAGRLLQALTDLNFDMILHGHQHVPNLATVKYLSKYRLENEILVNSAGTCLCRRRLDDFPYNHFSVIEAHTEQIPGSVKVNVSWWWNRNTNFEPYHVEPFSYTLRRLEERLEESTGIAPVPEYSAGGGA